MSLQQRQQKSLNPEVFNQLGTQDTETVETGCCYNR